MPAPPLKRRLPHLRATSLRARRLQGLQQGSPGRGTSRGITTTSTPSVNPALLHRLAQLEQQARRRPTAAGNRNPLQTMTTGKISSHRQTPIASAQAQIRVLVGGGVSLSVLAELGLRKGMEIMMTWLRLVKARGAPCRGRCVTGMCSNKVSNTKGG